MDQWRAFEIGVGVGIGIESLSVTVAFHSLTEAKRPAEIFDNGEINIKFFMSETDIAPFESDSDNDPDHDETTLHKPILVRRLDIAIRGPHR